MIIMSFGVKLVLDLVMILLYLDPSTDPYDLIKIYAIEAGGFSIVAKNLSTS